VVGGLHSIIDTVYVLDVSDEDWIELIRDVSKSVAPLARVHAHVVDREVEPDHSEVSEILDRDTSEVVARLISPDLYESISEPEAWTEDDSIGSFTLVLDMRSERSRFMVMIEGDSAFNDTDLKAIELFMHHLEVSFIVRQLLTSLAPESSPRRGLTSLMRALREEADHIGMSDSISDIWQGLLDGRWSLIELTRNRSRWQLVVKENPEHLVDPRALSTRERQVLQKAARGERNKNIAADLELDPSTVASYLQRGLTKLRLSSRVELVGLRSAIQRCEEKADEIEYRDEVLRAVEALERTTSSQSRRVLNRLQAALDQLNHQES